MIYVKVQRGYYGGIDLHSRSMTVCIMNSEGKVVFRKTISNRFEDFLSAISPFKHNIAFGVEATFNWYWLVDQCRTHGVEIYLSHTYNMKLIYGDKNKNDKLDAYKIAKLLRGGFLPYAHACSYEKRAIRDLLRQRHRLVAQRSMLLGQAKIFFYQYGCVDLPVRALRNKRSRASTVESMPVNHVRTLSTINMELVGQLEKHIADLELAVEQDARAQYPQDLELLLTVPGIGPMIALTILYEIDTVARFKTRQQFSSYCRLVRPMHTSNGKTVGSGNSKSGNSALKWAFMEILSNAPNQAPQIKDVAEHLRKRFPKLKARAILANRFATAVYYMLKNKTPFDINRFMKAFPEVVSPLSAAGTQLSNTAA